MNRTRQNLGAYDSVTCPEHTTLEALLGIRRKRMRNADLLGTGFPLRSGELDLADLTVVHNTMNGSKAIV